tara:strand:+ start:550 stop:756 length:207 start_codon:yes stop_codon:yes gene_type:complete
MLIIIYPIINLLEEFKNNLVLDCSLLVKQKKKKKLVLYPKYQLKLVMVLLNNQQLVWHIGKLKEEIIL